MVHWPDSTSLQAFGASTIVLLYGDCHLHGQGSLARGDVARISRWRMRAVNKRGATQIAQRNANYDVPALQRCADYVPT